MKVYEFWFAIKYLKSKRNQGGISIMTLISYLGISLAVFALIATLTVRDGFRDSFVSTVIGSEAHISILPYKDSGFQRYSELIDLVTTDVDELYLAWASVNEQVMLTSGSNNLGAMLYGIEENNIKTIPLINAPEEFKGEINLKENSIIIGWGLAQNLGVTVGDTLSVISPNGFVTPFGRSPLIEDFIVTYIFKSGRYDIDNTKTFIDISYAQDIFSKNGEADQLHLFVDNPENVGDIKSDIVGKIRESEIAGAYIVSSWKDRSEVFLEALDLEDSIMFIIMSILVLIASLNIVSGLIMLVKNKNRDIGILRTMGYSQNSILKIFFICGASVGILGTTTGVIMGVVFSLNIDSIIDLVSWLNGQEDADRRLSLLGKIPSKIDVYNIFKASSLSVGLSFVITYFPARKAARIEPVKALKNE